MSTSKTQILSAKDYEQHSQKSLQDPTSYWADVAQEFVWEKSWQKILQGKLGDEKPLQWFSGAELNITANALDRHLKDKAQKVAIYFEPNNPQEPSQSLTYAELAQQVNRFANVLKNQGLKKGAVVCFYMSMVPELLVGVLACARLGLVHNVVFGGFSASALASRLQDSGAQLLVTQDEVHRGDKVIALKAIADEALQESPRVKKVLVHERTGGKVSWQQGRDLSLSEALQKSSVECDPVAVGAEDPLFLLYTSGSTGKPKGLLHTTAGYMVWAAKTFEHVFQMKSDSDVYWCTADIGWITGHSYIAYGPLLNGVTQVMFEGVPTWPTPGRFWEVIEKYKVTHFYTAPTAIRALQAFDLSHVTKHNLQSLKVLGTVGEPINEEAWQWYHEHIGQKRCPIVDTWWQTETGGIMISSLAGVTPSVPTFATLPLPGVDPVLLTPEGKEITESPAEGLLAIRQPWPGMARTIFGDHERYLQTYFSTYKGYYFTGDGARRDEKGQYRIIGRVDDVVNVSGHRIGTAEVEDMINLHPEIVESAVIGVPHEIKGQGLVAFATMAATQKSGSGETLKEVNQIITKGIGAIAKLEAIYIVSGLPKTRSGKIMRRLLRKAAVGDKENLGDTSTLLNPEVVDEIFSTIKSSK